MERDSDARGEERRFCFWNYLKTEERRIINEILECTIIGNYKCGRAAVECEINDVLCEAYDVGSL
jgi:hypothetical protein